MSVLYSPPVLCISTIQMIWFLVLIIILLGKMYLIYTPTPASPFPEGGQTILIRTEGMHPKGCIIEKRDAASERKGTPTRPRDRSI